MVVTCRIPVASARLLLCFNDHGMKLADIEYGKFKLMSGTRIKVMVS